MTNRVKGGEAGFTIEFGRPGVGVRFRDVQKLTTALAPLPVEFEDKNPVSSLMTDRATGALQPDILVKGGDWAIDKIVGRATVEARGGIVTTIPLVPGLSTTALLQRIRATTT